MHIWVISQFYKPESSNPSTRLGGFAHEWKKAEADVSILTATPNHPRGITFEDYDNKPTFMHEKIDGVDVYRHWIYKNPNRSTKTRFLAQLSFSFSLLINLLRTRPRKPDVILASSPSLLPAFAGWLLARRYRAKFVFESREPWPGLFIELGRFQDGKLVNFLVKMQKFLVNRADLIITPTDDLARDVTDIGAPSEKIETIPNGFPDEDLGKANKAKDSGAVESLRTELQISPMTKIVMFLGDHGTPQALGQVVEAANRFLSRSDVLFLFVGDGSDKQRLKSMARGMPNVQFIPAPETQEKLWAYYGLASVCLVPTKDIASLKKVTPSRLTEILGAGRPCVASVGGVTAEMLNKARTALVAPPEDSEKLAYAILKLLDNPDKAELLGEKAEGWVKENYTNSRLGYTYFAQMRKLLKK
mgnify:CR=1 FL=1